MKYRFLGKNLPSQASCKTTDLSISKSNSLLWRRSLIVVICIYFVLMLVIGLFRHWGNMSSLNDLGFFDQAVWGTLHGQWFLDTNNEFGKPINWLSCHFNLFLIFFVPLYAIYPATAWFTIAQALALSIAAWPIFILASNVNQSERTGFLWALIYLANPFLLSAAAWDFHPVTLAVPFIAGALLSVQQKRKALFIFSCFFLLLIQEQFGLTVAGFGVLWVLKHRDWKTGLTFFGIGLMHTILVPGLIMPSMYPLGTHNMIDPSSQNSRYGWLGGSLFLIFNNIVQHPIWVLNTIIHKFDFFTYLKNLVLPFLGLSLLAPAWLLPGISDFAANTLSAINMPRSIIAYHSVTLVPILTVSAIHGVQRITPYISKIITRPLAEVVLFTTAVTGYIFAPLPLPGALNFWRPVNWVQFSDANLEQVRTLVSKSSSVSVQANVGAHFSQHQQVYRYPYKVGEVDTIVLWLDSPTLKINPDDGIGIGSITHHLQMKPSKYLASIESLLNKSDYGVVLWKEPWLVLAKGAKVSTINGVIRKKLGFLRYHWKVDDREYVKALKEI